MSTSTVVVGEFMGEPIAMTLDELDAHRKAARWLLSTVKGEKRLPVEAPSSEPLMTSEELAAVLGVPRTSIEAKARAGKIRSRLIGRWRRYARREVEEDMRRAAIAEVSQ